MIKKIFLALLLLINEAINAQTPKISIDGTPLNTAKLKALEQVTWFKLNADTSYYRKSIFDVYLKNKTAIDHVNCDSILKTNFLLRKKVVLQQKIAANKIRAALYEPKELELDSIKTFYTSNLGLFTEPGYFDAIVATLYDTSAKSQKIVKQKLQFAATATEEIGKVIDPAFILREEKKLGAGPGKYLYNLRNLPGFKADTIISYRNSNAEPLMLYIKKVVPDSVIPFELAKTKAAELLKKQQQQKLANELLNSEAYKVRLATPSALQSKVGEYKFWGTIGADTIDNYFLEALQAIDPGFAYAEDSAAFTNRLFTYYILPAYYARQIKSSKSPSKDLDDELQFAESIITYRVLAGAIENKSTPPTVTDKEIDIFYNEHQKEYTIKGNCAYLYAILPDTTSAAVSEAKSALKKALLDSVPQSLKNATYGFKIGYQQNFTFGTNSTLEKLLTITPLNKISNLFYPNPNDYAMMVVIISRVPSTVKPLIEVKPEIVKKITLEKSWQIEQDATNKALKRIQVN